MVNAPSAHLYAHMQSMQNMQAMHNMHNMQNLASPFAPANSYAFSPGVWNSGVGGYPLPSAAASAGSSAHALPPPPSYPPPSYSQGPTYVTAATAMQLQTNAVARQMGQTNDMSYAQTGQQQPRTQP
jgi:hypothetical protein